jgi:predicted DNA-binding transcriptional regulator AlpA
MLNPILRYDDLKRSGVVNNRATLYRWIKYHGFPPGVLIGPNSRAWAEKDVLGWLSSRPVNGTSNTNSASLDKNETSPARNNNGEGNGKDAPPHQPQAP